MAAREDRQGTPFMTVSKGFLSNSRIAMQHVIAARPYSNGTMPYDIRLVLNDKAALLNSMGILPNRKPFLSNDMISLSSDMIPKSFDRGSMSLDIAFMPNSMIALTGITAGPAVRGWAACGMQAATDAQQERPHIHA
jgi:hypothetical protein